MTALYVLLLALAAVCFLVGTLGGELRTSRRVFNLTSLGLLLWVLVPLISTAQNL